VVTGPPRVSGALAVAGGALVLALVAVVYRAVVGSNFFNDDFHWLFEARRLEWSNLVRLDRYNHFYRPVVEIYFHLGQRVFGCDPMPFHVLSVGIHLVNTGLLFLLTRALTASSCTAFVTVLLFCVQPGYVEAVVWVGAITDLLPATWFLLVLWLHVRFLQRQWWGDYAAALAAFLVCLGTHESAVTILPMMVAVDALLDWPRPRHAWPWIRARVARYTPFAVALAGFLVVAYVVNSRSYLVREGHYALGWHALGNLFDYVAGMYVGRRRLLWHIGVALVAVAILARGTPRMRFALAWIVVTLLPVLPFTWGTASRYLYVPAAGFALLLAELVIGGATQLQRAGWPRRNVHGLTALVVTVLVLRFATFAEHGVRNFRDLTRPYDRLTTAVRQAALLSSGELHLPAAEVEGIDAIYLDAAAETALCRTGVRVVVP
jgi:hypothetical protein